MSPAVDPVAAGRFLDALAGQPGAAFSFQTFPEGPYKADGDEGRALHGTFDRHRLELTSANAQRCGVSVTANETDLQGRRRANIVRPRALFLDVDRRDLDQKLVEESSALVRTPRGWHVYFFLEPPPDPDRPDWTYWKALQQWLCTRFEADNVTRAGCLRVPGFWHHKQAEPALVELEQLTDRRFTLRGLAEAFNVPPGELFSPDRERRGRYGGGEPQGAPPRATGRREGRPSWWSPDKVPLPDRVEQYRAWVAEQPAAVEGNMGHFALRTVVKMGWNFGLDRRAAYEIVFDYNDRCDPPWGPRDFDRQFESHWDGDFDADSFGSALWVDRPEPVVREGPQPHDDAPFPDEPPPRRQAREEDPPFPDDTHVPSGAGSGGGGAPVKVSAPGSRAPRRLFETERPDEPAEQFVGEEYSQEGVRTLHRQNRVYWSWAGDHYEELDDELLWHKLMGFAAQCRVETRNGAKQYGTGIGRVRDIERAIRGAVALPHDKPPPFWLAQQKEDPSPSELLITRNGMVHLPTGRFIPPDPRLFCLNALGAAYDPNAGEPAQWIRFLEQLWPDDHQSHNLLQEWFGYCLTSDTSHHKALMIVGPPRAGKGTIATLLRMLLGERSVTSMNMGDFDNDFGLWRLLGKSLAVIPDARVSARYNTTAILEKFLTITGGDLVSVNRKNLAPVDTVLSVRFMLLTNLVPQIADAALAFPNRLLPLSLEKSYLGVEDRGLLPRLSKELPGLLNWAIAGWHRLRKQGRFTVPGTAEHVMGELIEASSPIQSFVQDVCILDPSEECTRNELYEAYRKWTRQAGRNPMSRSSFGRSLRAAVPQINEVRFRTDASERTRGYGGIKIDYAALNHMDRDERQGGMDYGGRN